ncbi:PREDICTED: F-box protein At1g30790-like [Camelina sativa]|uniref:F-box protein At1g30790-like n=1 Tax=Camelina sativa TaxID=90675 RepID=A0ABM0Y4K3_CAMSA|nr:PREDICTED: F-box protein At1g30790-like [Camelina sativa]
MEDSESSPSRKRLNGSSTKFIPLDLTVEILCRLPGEALIRFQAVSKLWFSTIRSKDFADSFLIRSKTRPRFLFTFKHFDSRKRFIFSAPEHGRNDRTSTAVARHDMTISDLVYYIRSRPVNGFVCCTRGSSIAVCNPTTRQIVKLPDLEHYVFTLQSQQKEWRKIEITQSVRYYYDVREGICINGVIYYIAEGSSRIIIRFDVRSEKLDLIQPPEKPRIRLFYDSSLLNYNGKLGGIEYDGFNEVVLWILEDAEKQEWSETRCARPSDLYNVLKGYVNLKGEIRTGELIIIGSRLKSSIPFSVWYYDFQRESIRRVDIEGIADDEFRRVYGIGKRTREILSFPGFVENIMYL